MKRGKPSSKRKAPSKNGVHVKTDDSFLHKLQLLRAFVGPAIDESDLSSCLRQCGYNVELAAERLITGEYTPSPKTGGKRNFFTSTSAASASTPSTVTPSVNSAKKKPRTVPPSSSVGKSATKSPDSVSLNCNGRGMHLRLCQRWLVGLSTSRRGRVRHKEFLTLTSSSSGPPMVRFRGQNIEGTLPSNLCAMLSPLLRHDVTLISMSCEALMEESGVPIGGEVPISLSVYIEDPQALFGLFHSESADNKSSSSALFFESSNASRGSKKSKLKLPIAEAAFTLLQWAEYGDVPEFEPPPNNEKETESKEASSGESAGEEEKSDEEPVMLDEDQFDKEVATGNETEEPVPAWAKNVIDASQDGNDNATASLPEESDPDGLVNGVCLRSYQRQALYWMMRREKEPDNREELRNELELLSELASKSTRQPASLDDRSVQEGIVCDCGPVIVSEACARRSKTIDGQIDPVNHPLWQRRFLARDGMSEAISFYVNELIGIASSQAPNPPRQCVGGILSDAMGLGKTVMLLSLILRGKEMSLSDDADAEKPCPVPLKSSSADGATLVVTPLSLLAQWEEEIATKTSLSHRVYYGDTARGAVPVGVDVVVTTYGTVQGELASCLRKGNESTKPHGLLSRTWERVILDEAHCIKNPLTVVSKACCALNSRSRWCVTGTPMQNSLQDVYGLLKFLRHEPWCEKGFWKAAITNSMSQGQQTGPSSNSKGASAADPGTKELDNMPTLNIAIDRVRRLLAPIILRRTKDTLSKDGKPILTLPPVDSSTVAVTLSTSEREFYNSLLEKSQSLFEGFIKAGTATKSWFAIFSLLQRLRQACDHVALTVKSQIDLSEVSKPSSSSPEKPASQPSGAQGKYSRDAVNEEFLEGLLEKFCSDQSAETGSDPSLDKENVASSSYTTQVANALDKRINSSSTTVEDECPICLETPRIHDAVITPCAHIFCRDCLVGFLRDGAAKTKPAAAASRVSKSISCPDGECPVCNEHVKACRIIAMSKSSQDGRTTTTYLISDNKDPSILLVKKDTRPPVNLGARQALEDALGGAESSKLAAVISELHKVWEMDRGSKVIVFSQFLGFLNLLEVSLQKNNIPFNRLDGKMNLKQRVAALEEFNKVSKIGPDDEEVASNTGSVLLVSMKAGGVGLNLVAASSVFIVDPWWNEAVEDQCIHRIHRIGQTAEVVRVRKFVVTDSVEERILSLQRRKKAVASDILSDAKSEGEATNAQPTLDDFKILFGR